MKEENNFEEKMKELENLVVELEKGELNLDDSVKKFEQGMKISKECNDILEKAEKSISILLEKDDDIEESDFNTDNNID